MRRVRHGSKLFTFISLLILATVFEERTAASQSAPWKMQSRHQRSCSYFVEKPASKHKQGADCLSNPKTILFS